MTISIGGLSAHEAAAPALPAVSQNYVGSFSHNASALASAKGKIQDAGVAVRDVLADFARTVVGANASDVRGEGLVLLADGNVQVIVGFTRQGVRNRAYLTI